MILAPRCFASRIAAAAAMVLAIIVGVASGLDFPGPDPGPARAAIQGDTIVLENNVLKFTWSTAGGRLKPKEFVDKLNGLSGEPITATAAVGARPGHRRGPDT